MADIIMGGMNEREIGYEEIAKIEEFVNQSADLLARSAVPKLPVYFWCQSVERLYDWVDGEELYQTILETAEFQQKTIV